MRNAALLVLLISHLVIGCSGGVPNDLRKAVGLVEQQRWQEARAALGPAMEADPDRPLLRYLLGVIDLESGGDLAAAATQFEKTLALSATFDLGDYFLPLADYYTRTGRIGRAVDTYRTCLGLHSDDQIAYSAHVSLAKLYEAAGNYDEATRLYESAIRTYRRRRDTAGLELHLAEIYEKHLGKMTVAVASYERVAARYPGSPEASLAKSALILMRRQHPEHFHASITIAEQSVRRTTTGFCIRGKVRNAGDVAAGFATVNATLLGENGRELGRASAYVKGLHVRPGRTADFEVKLPDVEYSEYSLELEWEEMGY